MSVGDLRNNLRKLQAAIKGVNYKKDVDIEGVSKGKVEALLPLYHYTFLDYSRPLAEKISALNVDLMGKADDRFIEGMYKVLREMFSYKPPVTKDQFFSPSFAEIKIIMCTDILLMMRNKHRELTPRCSSSKVVGVNTSTSSQPKKQIVSAVKAMPSSRPTPKEPPLPPTKTTNVAPRVVNEKKSGGSVVSLETPSSVPQSSKSVTFRNTPEIQDTKTENTGFGAVEVINLDEEDESRPAPIPMDLLLKTPGMSRSRPVEVTRHTVNGPDANGDVIRQISHIAQSLQDLSARFAGLENRMTMVEGLVAASSKQLEDLTCSTNMKESSSLNPQQLETLIARHTLVENDVAILKAEMQSLTKPNAPRSTPTVPLVKSGNMNGHANMASTNTGHSKSVFEHNMEPISMTSPIPQLDGLQNGMSSALASAEPSQSTPIQQQLLDDNTAEQTRGKEDDIQTENGNGAASESQVARICNMLKLTETMLNIQVETPTKPPLKSP